MDQFILWEYHAKLWMWHEFGWWLIVVPIILYVILVVLPRNR